MMSDLHALLRLATKEKDISPKMPKNESLIFFIEKLDSEPNVFVEDFLLLLIE